ncbi:MAG: DUF1467 family protein [Rickettsiales bacterium]|nr:MAG: DUF1467 family protein [Rickettsiales bacterium]
MINNIGSFIIIFTVIWWIGFFIILPIGVNTDYEKEKGHADSAPSDPKIIRKIIINSSIALLISFLLEWSIYKFELIKIVQ